MYSIYRLRDPRDGAIKYVGMSSQPDVRFLQHLSLKNATALMINWLQELQEAGLQPILEIIEMVETRPEALKRERYWIRYHKREGCPLLNMNLAYVKTVSYEVRRHERVKRHDGAEVYIAYTKSDTIFDAEGYELIKYSQMAKIYKGITRQNARQMLAPLQTAYTTPHMRLYRRNEVEQLFGPLPDDYDDR